MNKINEIKDKFHWQINEHKIKRRINNKWNKWVNNRMKRIIKQTINK